MLCYCTKASEQGWKTILHLFSVDWFGLLGAAGSVPTPSSSLRPSGSAQPSCGDSSAAAREAASELVQSQLWSVMVNWLQFRVLCLCQFYSLTVQLGCAVVSLLYEQLQSVPAARSAAVAGATTASWLQCACSRHTPRRDQNGVWYWLGTPFAASVFVVVKGTKHGARSLQPYGVGTVHQHAVSTGLRSTQPYCLCICAVTYSFVPLACHTSTAQLASLSS